MYKNTKNIKDKLLKNDILVGIKQELDGASLFVYFPSLYFESVKGNKESVFLYPAFKYRDKNDG